MRRSTVFLGGMMVIGFFVVGAGLVLLGPPGIALGAVALVLLTQLSMALVPTDYHRGLPGARPTAAIYRGWAARLVRRFGIRQQSRTPAADAALLAAGTPLSTVVFAQAAENRIRAGHVVLRRDDSGRIDLFWHRRDQKHLAEPLGTLADLRLFPGRAPGNAMLRRMDFLCCAEIGAGVHWFRSHDGELLRLLGATVSTDLDPAPAGYADAPPAT